MLIIFASGHPTVLLDGLTTDISGYEGLIKCCVSPPRGLHLPLLPSHINGKLMFTLCRTCAETQVQDKCCHSDDERSLTGVWVSEELKVAFQLGYKIVKVYEVWHFDEVAEYNPDTKTGGLFTDYINMWLAVKQEASGWPAWCKTDADRDKYIQLYYDKEGVHLDPAKITKNEGLRTLAKLMLNR